KPSTCNFPNETGGQLLGVLHGRLTESQRLSDPHTMEFDGAPIPVILGVQFRRHAELLGDMDDRRGRDVPFILREASLILEALEQEGTAETSGGGSVCQKGEILRV